MLTDIEKQEILHHLRGAILGDDKLKQEIDNFIINELGVGVIGRTVPITWGSSFRWMIYLDRSGRVVAEDPLETPIDQRAARIVCFLMVSRIGPYVTAQSFTIGACDVSGPSMGGTGFFDEPDVRPQAVAWARAIAQRFGLKYLDAKELREWKIPEEVAHDAGIFLDASEPDGFNLLFYEF